jgi:Fic-DOC domain mobile mystery protein B
MTTFDYPDAATPIDPNEVDGLLLSHIATRAELDVWEQSNIMEAEAWAFGRKHKNILGEKFICRLHKRMFGKVWRWAGEFRRSEKNIGVPWWLIAAEVRSLCDDVSAWVDNASYPPDEIAARFHHRLVAIHLFPNGNGRHARTMADLLLVQRMDQPRFSWGSSSLTNAGDCRHRYIAALRSADEHDYDALMAFVRS